MQIIIVVIPLVSLVLFGFLVSKDYYSDKQKLEMQAYELGQEVAKLKGVCDGGGLPKDYKRRRRVSDRTFLFTGGKHSTMEKKYQGRCQPA